MSEAETVSSNLTFDDVVNALGETDPNGTNAAKLRTVLGRGGLTTIQKHLDKIRADQAAALVPVEDVKAPTMPDSVAAMWGAAYGTAMAMVRMRLDAVVQERDALAVRLTAGEQDREAWEAEVQGTAAELANTYDQLHNMVGISMNVEAECKAAVDQAKAASEATEARLRAEIAEARHAVQVTELQAKNGAQAMQVTIDRLTDQIGELKSLLHAARAPEATEASKS